MSEHNEEHRKSDEELVSVDLDSKQSRYLQALGLKTLLAQKFTKPVKRFWHDLLNVNSNAWPSLTLFFVLLFALTAIVLTLSANVPHVVGKCETCGHDHLKKRVSQNWRNHLWSLSQQYQADPKKFAT